MQLQFKPADGSSDWTPFGQPISVTSAQGYFTAQVPAPGAGQVRGVWLGPAQTTFASLGQSVR